MYFREGFSSAGAGQSKSVCQRSMRPPLAKLGGAERKPLFWGMVGAKSLVGSSGRITCKPDCTPFRRTHDRLVPVEATGKVFRRVSTSASPGERASPTKLAWHVVKEFSTRTGANNLAPHDLRRTCARLCRAAGGELEQIQFLLGHVAVQTTERYLGCT